MTLRGISSNWSFTIRHFSKSNTCLERLRPVAVPSRIAKSTKLAAIDRNKHFVDWLRVRVVGGDGGNGALSLLSVFRKEFAGPDGGDGGNGGHVIFRANKTLNSLNHLKNPMAAEPGVSGGIDNCEGKNAQHRIVDVPPGTIFRNLEREIVAEVVEEGSMFIAARGGGGGKGNAFFKTAQRQTPLVAEKGGQGETFTFDIELRSMAHVGLIGFPNAGKSTLLRAMSRARPKVAAYPFTTLNPHIGMVPYDDNVQLAVADIPGLIPDAHKNRGLGISFLRHVERCLCLLYVIDLSQPNPQDQLDCLRYELEQYSPGLSTRPHGIIANKMDLDKAKENITDFEQFLKSDDTTKDINVLKVSGKQGLNIAELLHFIRLMYDQYNTNNEKTSNENEINSSLA